MPTGELFATVGTYPVKPDDWLRVLLLRSDDRGLSWHYVSTVMGRSNPHDLKGFDNECDLTVCPNGDLLALARTERTKPLRLLVQSRSSDGGKSWSDPVPCPGVPGVLWPFHSGNVSPSLCNLNNGVMAVAYGRPAGLMVAFNSGGPGDAWEPLSLIGSLREGLLEQHYGLMSTSDLTIPGNLGMLYAHRHHVPRIVVTGPGSFLLAYDLANYSPFVVEDDERKDLVAPDPDYPARNSIFVIPITVRKRA